MWACDLAFRNESDAQEVVRNDSGGGQTDG